MNFFKFYIGDYQRDTAHLSLAEHGAYSLMLQAYYATEKPLPKGKALHRMLRAQDRVERDAIDTVAAQFWIETDAGLVNGRSDKEIARAKEQAGTNARIARAREAARRGARKNHEPSTNRATIGITSHSQTPEEDSEDLRSSGVPPSVADAPAPQEDPRKALWDLGVSLLGTGGRSVIGQAIKRVGEQKVASVLGGMAAKPPADPLPYFIGATQERGLVV